MIKKFLFFLIIVAVGAGAYFLRGGIGDGNVEEVVVEPLAGRDIQASVLASGKLAHEEEVLLSTEEIGKVTAIYVEEGDRVERGQLLLQIDDQALSAAVAQNQANVRLQEIAIERQQLRISNLRTQWNRQRELFDRQLLDRDSFDLSTNELEIAEIDLLSSREQLSQARAQMNQAQDRLSKTQAFSPISGTVTSLDIKVGETAISSTTNVPGSSLMTIANTDSIITEVNVDEADIANVEVGQMAEIVAIAYPDQPLEGVIKSISISARTAEGSQGLSFAVKIDIDRGTGITLRPGMTCRAEIFTNIETGILAVPIQAIFVNENLSRNTTAYHVFVHEAGRARRIEVDVGISDDAYQEIKGDVSLGDEIIIGPDRVLRNLEDGDRISLAAD